MDQWDRKAQDLVSKLNTISWSDGFTSADTSHNQKLISSALKEAYLLGRKSTDTCNGSGKAV